MRLFLDYAARTKAGIWQYRRRVPKDLLDSLGKREFKKKLGVTESEAKKAYARYHATVEREIALARKVTTQGRVPFTDLEAYEIARELVETDFHNLDSEMRGIAADGIASQYQQDPETDDPIDASDVDRHTINLLRGGVERYQRPSPTLADAVKFYITEKLGDGGENPDHRTIVRVRRNVSRVAEALKKPNPTLADITREDARTVRDYLLKREKGTGERVSAASALRELNTIRAVIE